MSIREGDRVTFDLVPGQVGTVRRSPAGSQGPWKWVVDLPADNEAGYAPYPAHEHELHPVEDDR